MANSVYPWVIALLLIMSTYRITRFITRDVFPPIRWLRETIERKLGEEHWFAYLTQCDWCASIYVSAGVMSSFGVYVARVEHESWWPWPVWIMLGLTASAVTGLIAQKEPE